MSERAEQEWAERDRERIDAWLDLAPDDPARAPGPSIARALAYIEKLEAALRLIADDDYPEAWGEQTARGMRDVARSVLRPTSEIGPRWMEDDE